MAIFTSGTTPFVLKAGDGISIKSAANTSGTISIAGEAVSDTITSSKDYWYGLFDAQREVVVTVTSGSVDVTVGGGSTANLDAQNRLVGPSGVVLDVGAAQAAALGELFVTSGDAPFNGDGVTNNDAALSEVADYDGVRRLPKPSVKYKFSAAQQKGFFGSWLPDPAGTWRQLTDDGKLSFSRDFVTNKGATQNTRGAAIWRLCDRVFVGEAGSKFAGDSLSNDIGTSWMSNPTTSPASYLAVNAQLLSVTESGKAAIVGASRSSDNFPGATNAIGVGSAVKNDLASGNAWGFIAEVVHGQDANITHGIELAVKNTWSLSQTMTPYLNAGGAYGLWCAGGGDDAFGGAPAAPSNAAIAVVGNSSTWNIGLVFRDDALTGTNGAANSTTTAVAIGMARRHIIQWYEPTTGGRGAHIDSKVTTGSSKVGIVFEDDVVRLVGNSEANIAVFNHTASMVNHLSFYGGAAGSSVRLLASGSDANIDLRLSTKGTGVVRFGTFTSSADVPVTGYITIKDDAGTVRKIATVA